MPWIEVVHWRDSDEGCELTVFVDGMEVTADVYEIDPGRGGWTRAEWDLDTEAEVSRASSAVAAVLRDARNDAADNSPYVEGD